MHRKAEMADAALGLLPEQIVVDAVLPVKIGVDVHFAYVVEKIKVKIRHAAAPKLFFKNLLHLRNVRQIIAGEFVGEIEAVARIRGKHPAHHALRTAVVVAVGGVEIVDAVSDGVIDHLLYGGHVDVGEHPVDDRQPHRAHTERGQLQVLKRLVDHKRHLVL